MSLVIVESPAKAKTIKRYLGGEHVVLASYGHLRDLVAKDGAVLPDENFAMKWQVSAKSAKHIAEITRAVKTTDKLILATDPDREGEAIAWHLLETLRSRHLLAELPIERVVFNAITKSAVLEAVANPRQIDENLVNAYLARRALDYLVGFTLSPVLWRKLPGVKSAGRVQSTALRLICERETARDVFKPQDYWTIDLHLLAKKEPFTARLSVLSGEKLGKWTIKSTQEAEAACAVAMKANWFVENIESKPTRRHAAPPFTTSTLQQEASRKLGFSADRAMRAAQKLYDGSLGSGFITYMRTDSVNVTPSAIAQARTQIKKQFGATYVPEKPNYYRTKSKNAQEAHEAIRPTDFSCDPSSAGLSGDEGRLYDLIWKRALASQMKEATFQRTQLTLHGDEKGSCAARATGNVLIFDGFLKIYFEGRDLPENDDEDNDKEQKLPVVIEGQALKIEQAAQEQHTTQPPPRFTEASLVKRMEELGIGRPSTYAPIMNVLRQRDYVVMEKKQLVPESRGRLVTAFLEKHFGTYVDYNFTAGLEEQLDKISAGKEEWRHVLHNFWVDFIKAVEATAELRTTNVLDDLNEQLAPSVFPEEKGGRTCSQCEGGELSIKVSRFGSFVGCSNYPNCSYTRPLTGGGEGEDGGGGNENRELGTCPDTEKTIFIKTGRFGPYVERAKIAGEDKAKRCSVPKSVEPAKVELALALQLLSLPRVVGKHPEDDEDITAGISRYGGFVKHGAAYASLKQPVDALGVDVEEAVAVLAKPRKARASASGGRKTSGKVLGEHPEGGEIELLKGRFGPYVKHNKTNASLGAIEEDELTLERATQLIDERRAKTPAKKQAIKRKAAKKKIAKNRAKSKTLPSES